MIKLLPHQQQAYDQTKDLDKVAYYLDMGLGKTFLGSYKAEQLGDQILVVCQKSKVDDWVNHFREFHPKLFVADLTARNPDYSADVLVINYDIVWRRPQLYDLKNFTLMLDESSCVKNPKSNRTQIFTGNRRPKIQPLNFKNVILLSGTPTGGKYEELITQIHLLGWNISKDTFWQHYVVSKDVVVGKHKWGALNIIKQVIGYKNVDRLKRKLKEVGCVFMKTEEVMELPEQTHTVMDIRKPSEYTKFMKESSDEHRCITINGKELLGDTILTQLLYARQISSLYNKHKHKALEDLLESTEDRIIIFYNWSEEYELIKKMVKKLKKPFSAVNGSVKSMANYENCDNAVIAIQYQAGAMGLNLQKSNKIVYFSLPLSGELFEQSKKRTHRIGQERPCFYWYMVTKGTLEEDIMKTLEKREDYNAELFRR